MTSHADAGAAAEPSSRRIQADIDRTRAHMDSTFDALESKLTPGQLMQEGWDLLKGGSGAGAKKIFEIAREHPLPSAVIGVGLGLLLLDSNRKDRGYDGGNGGSAAGRARTGGRRGYGYTGSPDYPGTRDARYARGTGYQAGYQAADLTHQAGDLAGQAKEKVSDLAGQATDKLGQAKDKVSELASQTAGKVSDLTDTVREQASELGDKVGRGARQAKLGFWQLMEERPLIVGAATLAVGLLAGLSIPATEAEDEWMGETRDQLLDRAQEGAREMLDKGKHVADSAVDTLKQTVESEGLSVDKLAEKVKHVAQETTETVKQEAANQKLVPDLGADSGKDQQQQQKPGAQSPAQQGSGQQTAGQPKQQPMAGQQVSRQPNQQPAGQPPAGQPGGTSGKGDATAPVHQEPELAKR